jgi:rhodanese-related sulfurtransferase
VHIPVRTLGDRTAEIPQDREIYVICRAGSRSAYAAQALAGAGWQTVNVADGMAGWAVAGRPMVSETGGDPFVA